MRGVSELQGKGQSREMRGEEWRIWAWELRTSFNLLKSNLVIALSPTDIDQRAWLFPKCDSELLYGIAHYLHKPKTQLFPKNCVLYLTKRAFCVCFLQNRLFGLGKLKQTSTKDWNRFSNNSKFKTKNNILTKIILQLRKSTKVCLDTTYC